MTDKIDSDDLPPTQYLVLEVLAARHRTGEHQWTFPSRFRGTLRELSDLGLVGWKGGIVEKTVLAWLTDTGRSAALMDGYETPIDKALAVGRQAGREDAARELREAERRIRERNPHRIVGPVSEDWLTGLHWAAATIAGGTEVQPTEEQS